MRTAKLEGRQCAPPNLTRRAETAHSFASTSCAQRRTRWCAIAYGGGVRSDADSVTQLKQPLLTFSRRLRSPPPPSPPPPARSEPDGHAR
eukprot:scaffold20032_cov66-Phaeocystis_antarctica.AAC.2